MARWATFDCYGTLIDWNRGIGGTIRRLWPGQDAAVLLARYHQLEPAVEQTEPTLGYRAVMAHCLTKLADERGLPLAPQDEQALGSSLPDWPAFPEVAASLAELRRRGWRLAILSNTDHDLLAASMRHLGGAFEELVIASEIGSYKPALEHWREFRARTGARREEHVHVGASLFHDIRPASSLGLRTVWINRLGEVPDPTPTRELADLAELPDALDGILA
jgi:2-haloacid dehalogenase